MLTANNLIIRPPAEPERKRAANTVGIRPMVLDAIRQHGQHASVFDVMAITGLDQIRARNALRYMLDKGQIVLDRKERYGNSRLCFYKIGVE